MSLILCTSPFSPSGRGRMLVSRQSDTSRRSRPSQPCRALSLPLAASGPDCLDTSPAARRRFPMPRFIDIQGERFGRLVARQCIGRDSRSRALWDCACDCGSTTTVLGVYLRAGRIASCGCGHVGAGATTHGRSKSRVYRIWAGMIQRCTNENRPAYANYGGRGIVVCPRWLSFENFYADMGDPPQGTSIDRIDNERGYEPGNCRWTPKIVQVRNTRNNIFVTVGGKTQTLSAWAEEVGVSQFTLYTRYRRGERPPALFRSAHGGASCH